MPPWLRRTPSESAGWWSWRAALTVLAALATACGGETQQAGSAQPREVQDITYTTVPRPLVLDLFLPGTPPPHPVIVWIHGGGWRNGDEGIPPEHAARQMVARGYAVASIEYRLSGEAVFPAQIQDCRAAIRWLRAHAPEFGLDRARIAAWGSSAGGHLAALLGTAGEVPVFDDPLQGNATESARVQAVVDWYGPSDLSFLLGFTGEGGSVAQLLGCADCADRARLASPVTYVDGSDPPFLIQHGTADTVVPRFLSDMLHSALLAAAVPSTYDVFPGAGHGGPPFSSPENLRRIQVFLDGALRR